MALHRAYSIFQVKTVDDSAREIRGIASTPEPDRLGDILDPKGASFKLPIPLLWQHRAGEPIGHVTAANVTKAGIEVVAKIADIGIARIDEAWTLIKAQLVRGLSVGFRPLEAPELIENGDDIGFKFGKWEWVELSAVTIPANRGAAILTAKSLAALDAPYIRAASGASEHVPSRGVARVTTSATMKKPFAEQIRDWENTRRTREDRRDAIMSDVETRGELPNDAETEELAAIDVEITKINAYIATLQTREREAAVIAKAVVVTTPASASVARDPHAPVAAVQVRSNLPLGQEFVRVAICKLRSFMDHGTMSPLAYAKALYPDCPRVHQYLERAAVPAAGTVDQTWAGALVTPTTIASEFLEFVRPSTILGKFGTGSVPSLRRVPFNARISGQTSGGTGYWVGQGAAKPLTKAAFNAQTLLWTKVAAIAVLTEELARLSSPSAEMLIREDLRDALVERLDKDFVEPTKAAVAGVSPASVTNGVAAIASGPGTGADGAREDIGLILNAYLATNQSVSGLALIMPETLALQLSLMRNPLGQVEFPGLTPTGGTVNGLPIITSQYAISAAGKNMVIAVNTRFVMLADDDQVTIDASREASLEMSDAPTGNSVTGAAPTGGLISMFQTNSIALRAERYVNWAKARTDACVWMDDVKWGIGGS